MATQDEMLRALVGLDDNSSNYTLADAVGNTDTTTARARSLIGLDDNPNNYTLADVLGYAAPSIPPPQPTGPTQQKRLEPPPEIYQVPTPTPVDDTGRVNPTPTAVNDTGRVNPNRVTATQPTITAVDIDGNPVTTDDLAALTSGAAPVYTNSTFNAADSNTFGPTLDTTASDLAALTAARALTSDAAVAQPAVNTPASGLASLISDAAPAALPTAYYAGETLQDYLAAQKAAFVPQHVAATYDIPTESNNYNYGTEAYDTAFGDTQGDIEKATNDYYKALYANDLTVVPIAEGWGLQDWVPSAAENNVDPNYAGWARLIGFQGPTVREAGYTYHPPEDYGAGESTSAGTTAGFYAPKIEATPEFKQALAGYGFRQTQDSKGNGIVEMVDPNMNVVGRQRVYSGEGSASQLIKASMMALAAYALGPAFGELLGAAGAGTLGSAAAGADLGLLGINTGLAAGTTGGAALGTAASLGGNALANTLLNTTIGGQDLGDAALNAAKSAGTSFAGSQIAGFAPTDLTGTGSTLLNQTATDLLKGAASGAVGAAASGNSIWEAALAGAASGGINSTVGSSLQGMGFKPEYANAGVKILNGIKNENYADILNGANQFVNSPDLALAGKAATLVRAIESKNPTAIFNAGKDFSSGLTSDAAAKIAAATTAGGRVLNTSSLEGAGPVGIETLFDPTRVVKKTTGDSADYGTATGIGAPGTSYTVSPGTTIPKTAGELAALANPDALGVLPGAGAAGSSYSASLAKAPDTSPAAQAVIARAANVQPTTYEQVEALKIISEMYPGQDLGWVTRGALNAAASHIFAGDEAGLRARLTSGQKLGVTGEAPTAESFARQSKYSMDFPKNYAVAEPGVPLSTVTWGYTDRGEPVANTSKVEVSGKKYSNMTPEEQAAYNVANPIARPESDYKIDQRGDKVLKSQSELALDFVNTLAGGLAAPVVKGIGEQLQDIGTVASWLGADPKNPVSRFGASVSAYGKEITPATVLEQQENITQAVKNESTFLGKAFAGVAAAVKNPLGFADWVGKELAQEVAPMGLALKAGQYTTKLASAFGESIAAKLGLGAAVSTDAILGAGESGASAYRDVYADLKKQGLSDDVAEAGANKAAAASAMITLVTSAVGDVSLYKNLLKSSEASIGKVVSEKAGSTIGKEIVTEFFDGGFGAGSSAVITQDSGAGWKDILTKTKLDLNNGIVGAMVGGGTTGTLVAASADPSSSSYTAPSGATTDLLTGAPAATAAPATTTAGTPATQTVLTGQGGETLSAGDLGVDTGAATVTENAPNAASIIQQYVDLGLAGGQTGNTAAELATLTGTGDVTTKAGDSSAVIGTDANGQAVTISDLQALTGNTSAVTTAGPGAVTPAATNTGANTVVATDANGQVVTLADIQALTGNTGATTTPGVTTGAAVDTGAAVNTGTAVDTGAAAATDTTPGVTTGTATATDTTPGVTTGTATATDTTPGVTTGTAVDTGAAVNTGAAVDTGAAVNTAVNSSTVINTATNGNTATNAVVATDPNVVTTTDSNGATVNSNTATGVTTVINNNANTIVTTDPNAQTVTATDVTANVTTVTNTATGVTVVVDSTVTPGIVTDTTVNPVVTPTVTTDTTVNPVVTPDVVTDPKVTTVVEPPPPPPPVVVEPPPPPPPVVVEPPPPPPPVVVEPPPPPPPVVVEPPPPPVVVEPPPPVVVEPPRPPPPPPKPPTPPPPPPPPPPRPTAAPSPSSPAGVLSQELMKLSDFDLEALFSPSLKEYRKEQRGKRSKPTEEDQMMDLLRELGYRS